MHDSSSVAMKLITSFHPQVSTPNVGFFEEILSHLASTCFIVLAMVIVIVWYIRDSYKVDAFNEKHVFITGCDSGFGNLLARQLDGKGFNVIAACLTEKGASDLASAASSRLKTLLLNVADSTSIRKAVEFVEAEVGQRGVIDVTLQFLPLVKKARGRVVNVASILGRLALTGGGYCLSKYGVEAFSDSLRLDMQHFGIKVSIIEPGFFKTAVTRVDLIEADLKRLWDRLTQEVKDSYGANYFDEYMKAQDFSMGILCSSDISKVTNCMQHALTARHPRTRYAAGWDAKLFWIPLSYLPTFVSDFVVNVLLPVPKSKQKSL